VSATRQRYKLIRRVIDEPPARSKHVDGNGSLEGDWADETGADAPAVEIKSGGLTASTPTGPGNNLGLGIPAFARACLSATAQARVRQGLHRGGTNSAALE